MLNKLFMPKFLHCIIFLFFLLGNFAYASVGMIEFPKDESSGPITLFYPTSENPIRVKREKFEFNVAENSNVGLTNKHLIVISHGSPASPWVYFDLARTLVESGFVVAIPEHYKDNYKDDSEPGIRSWKRRPVEISKAVDRLSQIPFLKEEIAFDNIGMYGMSAGGHTALTLAGGKWSPSQLLKHCEENIKNDFHTCAGPLFNKSEGLWGNIKIAVIDWVNQRKLNDTNWYSHTDSRIKAVIAGVPFAADFNVDSLQSPVVPLGLIRADKDIWLKPQYHIDPIILACKTCVTIVDIKNGGHGSLLSPLPSIQSGSIYQLIKDPAEFDRATEVPKINMAITQFFISILNVKKDNDR